MSIKHVFRSSRVNRDRRDQTFARSVIAEATKRFNAAAALTIARGLCCMARHANAVPPWTCDCPCHDEAKNAAILIKAGEIEVCPDCMGTGEVVRHVTDDIVKEQICLECNGRGYYEEKQ